MKVGYLTGRYPSISHTFILREAEALRGRGIDVCPISVWTAAPEDLLSAADREEARRTYALLPARPFDWARAHAVAWRSRPKAYFGVLRRALKLSQPSPRGVAMGALWFAEAMVLWHRCRAEEIAHVHAHLNGTAPSVALLAAAFGAEVGAGCRSWSLTVHGSSEFYDVARERLGAKVRAAAFVVCISDFTRSQLMGLVDETEWHKLKVVHCGIDPSVFRPEAQATTHSGPLELLCVGRLAPAKGMAVVLEAVAELGRRGVNVHATLVGDGPRRAALEAMASDLGLEDRATFTGAIGQDRIRSNYASADVFCMASFAEGVPVVLMEAMAMEIPCVATALMGIPELVEHGQTGYLVRPGRADLLADAIETLAADLSLRQAMGRAGREKVVAEFTIRQAAEQLEALFRET